MTSLMERSRILKFSASMLAAVLLAEGILFMATELLGLFYLFSAAIAMEAAVLFVFFLNDVWTFGDTENTRSRRSRLLRFNMIATGGLLINTAILFDITGAFGVWYLTANLVGVACAFTWNYLMNIHWSWYPDGPA